MTKKVAIVGAGASGITAIKCCLDEGLEPICFEQTDHIGGLWYYTDEMNDDVGCVMKTTVINTSKEMMCYSDFPIPGSYPNYMHHTKVLQYFNMYVDKFELKKNIRFKTKIVKIKPTPEFESTGQWEIEFISDILPDSEKEIFDAVLLCTGHHTSKRMPDFSGMDDFTGKQVHTHDYRDHRGYEDKRVVVVGIGNSGADVAVELSKICKQVFLSTRRGAWIVNRVSTEGMPSDLVFTRRFSIMLLSMLPRPLRNYIFETMLNKWFNHTNYGLRPDHRFDAQLPTVSDELPNRLACGTIVIKPNVISLTKAGVVFDDGTNEDDIDAIVYATGYKYGYPYVKHPGFAVNDNVPHLYKYMFAPQMACHTMATIGFCQPIGAIMPLSELQCRLATRVFKGLVKLPCRDNMEKEIQMKAAMLTKRYVDSPRHTIQVDWIPFMNEVAGLAGCKPNIMQMFLKDPRLASNVLFGPCTPYQYRLNGPGAWSGARDAILTQWDRVAQPLLTRRAVKSGDPLKIKLLIVLIVIVAVVIRWVLFWLIN